MWLIAKIDDVMRPMTLQVRHMEATDRDISSFSALVALCLAFSSSCSLFNKLIYKFVAKVSVIRVSLYGPWYCWGQAKCPLYGIARYPHSGGLIVCKKSMG